MAWPTPEDEQQLIRGLRSDEPAAPHDLAKAFLEPLIDWLKVRHPFVDEHLCGEAAGEAILNLGEKPGSFNPDLGKSLASYLKMSAGGDLLNLLKKERKHQSGRKSIEDVELGSQSGNEFGRADDPSRHLQLEEAADRADAMILAPVREGLTPEELDGLAPLIDGERATEKFVKALKLQDLPPEEWKGTVKKFKDKLKARMTRARELHDESL